MNETLCDAAASAQTAQGYRDFCAFAKIWEPTSAEKWRRNNVGLLEEDGRIGDSS